MNTIKTVEEQAKTIELRTELEQLKRLGTKISHQRRLEREIAQIERMALLRTLTEES